MIQQIGSQPGQGCTGDNLEAAQFNIYAGACSSQGTGSVGRWSLQSLFEVVDVPWSDSMHHVSVHRSPAAPTTSRCTPCTHRSQHPFIL
jgi:hypothetical protein